jgi:hypothetical protein
VSYSDSRLLLKLTSGKEVSAAIAGAKYFNVPVIREIKTNAFTPSFPGNCLTVGQIKEVYLFAPACTNDGWQVASLFTSYKIVLDDLVKPLTADPSFNRFSKFEPGNTHHRLNFVIRPAYYNDQENEKMETGEIQHRLNLKSATGMQYDGYQDRESDKMEADPSLHRFSKFELGKLQRHLNLEGETGMQYEDEKKEQ